MAFKIFLDANVILEYILRRKDAEIVDEIFVGIESLKYRAYTSVSVVQISSYWIEKTLGINKAKQIILSMLEKVQLINASHEHIVLALNSKIDDIEDAMQYYTALQHKMDYFITLDKKLIKEGIPSLPAYSPSAFLNL